MDRREFLKTVAKGCGAVAGITMLPVSVATARPVATGMWCIVPHTLSDEAIIRLTTIRTPAATLTAEAGPARMKTQG